jgi:hypothetical protein
LESQVLLKILKHSTDNLPPPPQTTHQQDRNAPPSTSLSSHTDAVGVLLGLDLEGVLEVEDSFALPGGEGGVDCECLFWSISVSRIWTQEVAIFCVWLSHVLLELW